MSSYPFEEYTRVALVPAVAILALPSTIEIDAGIDITCDLTRDGLSLPRTTEGVSRGPWHSVLNTEDPGRYGFNEPTLKGKRRTQDDIEPFYDAAIYQTSAFLVVRRGIPYDVDWDGGQMAEVIGFRFGKRTTLPSTANATTCFTVQLFVNADNDAAVVTGGHDLLTEDGGALLLEGGDHILLET